MKFEEEFSSLVECFESEKYVDDIVDAYLSNGLNDIRSMMQAPYIKRLTDDQKKELALIYIYNRKYDGVLNKDLRRLICIPKMHAKYPYHIYRKLLCYYLYDNRVYELILNGANSDRKPEEILKEVEDSIINDLIQDEDFYGIEKSPTNSSKYEKLLYLITEDSNIFRRRSSTEIKKLIYTSLEDEDEILPDIILDENLLRYRNIFDQIVLLRKYLSLPYIRVVELITDENMLKKLNTTRQLALIDYYAETQSEERFDEVTTYVRGLKTETTSYEVPLRRYTDKKLKSSPEDPTGDGR